MAASTRFTFGDEGPRIETFIERLKQARISWSWMSASPLLLRQKR
jgi:hypothetical protein